MLHWSRLSQQLFPTSLLVSPGRTEILQLTQQYKWQKLFSELRSFRRGRKGQPPKEAEYFYHYFVQPLTFLVCVFSSKFWYHLAPFWLDFGLRGVPGEPLGTLCGTPVAQGAQKCNF